MSSFVISPKLIKDKVFLVQKNHLEEVWDPGFYKPEFLENREKIKKNPYGLVKLRNITSKITKGETPLWRGDGYLEEGVLFVKSENVLENELNISDTDFISEEVHSRMKRSQLKKGDVLLNIVGASIGRACVYNIDCEANINQAICLIRLNKGFDPFWLSSLLNSKPYKTWINQIKSGGARDNIDLGQANEFLIPNHPKDIQEKIISINNKTTKLKSKNDKDVETLLASIDDYILSELGITIPPSQENTLKNRLFTSCLTEISGNRFDPFFHQSKFRNNNDSIRNCKYQVKTLREIITGNLVKGTLPKHEEKGGNNSVVQINCINPDGTISLDNLLTAKDIFNKEQKLLFRDILIVITGATIGKTAQWNYEGEYFLGGDLIKFQTNPEVDNSFVFHFLRSKPVQIEIKRNITGATNGHLAPEVIKNLLIPIPPYKKQIEIAANANKVRQDAEQLKIKTKEALAEAYKEIEFLLLSK